MQKIIPFSLFSLFILFAIFLFASSVLATENNRVVSALEAAVTKFPEVKSKEIFRVAANNNESIGSITHKSLKESVEVQKVKDLKFKVLVAKAGVKTTDSDLMEKLTNQELREIEELENYDEVETTQSATARDEGVEEAVDRYEGVLSDLLEQELTEEEKKSYNWKAERD